MGRCALHTTRSLAVSHATSAASTVSTPSCCIHGWRGRPRGRFHCGPLSGRWPVLALTVRCSAICRPEWLLEVVLHDQISHDVVSWSCHERFLGQSGLWRWRWLRSRTSGFRVYVAGMTCWMPRASVLRISAVSRSLHRAEGQRRQRHCTAAALWTDTTFPVSR